MEEFKNTYTIYGTKGSGKTTLAFIFKGNKLCYTYDNKSQRIKHYLFNDSPDITIVNGVEKYNRTPDHMTTTAKEAYDSIIDSLAENSGGYDWVIHDGLEKLHEICEQYMSGAYKLTPFQGVREMSIWKYRRVLLSNIHRKSIECANKGVIYTTFAGTLDVEIEDGIVIEKREVPRYFDAIEEETDVIFKTYLHNDKKENKTHFMVKVWSSKVPNYKTGQVIDFTDRFK